jgi:cell shape-determining protein MreC
MDGVFPEGLKVAYVHSIKALAEGAFAYELYAKPTAGDIQDLQYVTILAPQGFDQSQIPTRLERVIKQLAADD